MTGWLLDTDVLSVFAPGKRAVAPKVISWFEDRTEELYLSSITARGDRSWDIQGAPNRLRGEGR